ncbi:MAG TPA: hypothetical protein PLD47_06960 [Aggregatilineales bacterium]|nr:hypothetical protein [Anaerolineales bacterium]HRE47448.1 hypothetical protein [Aggregatilineales bacterium]
MVALHTPDSPSETAALPRWGNDPSPPTPRRRRRFARFWGYFGAALLIFMCGAVAGYTQGPRLATLVAAGGQAAQAFQQFQPCFNDLRNSSAFRGMSALFPRPTALPDGVPTPTPQPRTFDPTALKTAAGKLVRISEREITVATVDENGIGRDETLPFFPFNRFVTSAGREITRGGVFAGDQVDVLAFRLQEGGAHVVLCVIVNVDPAK